MHRRRVAITGLGILSPNGCGKEAFWEACLQGRSGVRTITRFDTSALTTRIAGEISDFSPASYGLSAFECDFLDLSTQFAVAAANLAMEDAGLASTVLQEDELEKTGVYLGTAMASVERGEAIWQRLAEEASLASPWPLQERELTTFLLSYAPSTAVAAHHCLRGPCLTISTGCSSGADAIGQAFWQIQEGCVDRMLAGGCDSALSAFGLSAFNVMHALSTRNDAPAQASRPYDASRDGFVLSEGAAVLVLEERELALARGAHIYAEIVAFSSNGNAYHMTALPDDGAPLQALLREILREAPTSPALPGYINAHGSSTLLNDVAETVAYKGVFGSEAYHIPISSTKSLIGHTQGAASAIETAVTALALDRQILPPTINLETPDPQCDLDYVANVARPLPSDQPLDLALTHSSGFGGVNTALMLARHTVSAAKAASTGEQHLEIASPSSARHPAVLSAYRPSTRRRVVITGIGLIAPGGIGKEAFWQSVCAGRRAIEPLAYQQEEKQRSWQVGQVKNFRVEEYIERKLARRTDRVTHFTLAAVQEALQDARVHLEQEDPRRIGAVIATTFGGVEYATRQVEQFHTRGPRFVSPYAAIAWLHVANVGQVSVRYGLQGYSKAPASDLSSGLDALGMAYNAIQRNAADILVAGGSEAPLHPHALRVLSASLPLCQNGEEYRPFDQRASGLQIAEGSGICILEEYEHALRRGATIYGEIVGYAQTCSPRNAATSEPPDITAYTRALQLVLDEAGLTPAEIACAYLDGRALPDWDISEVNALRRVFGPDFETLMCSVPRTQFGHTLAAAGALDTICALLALQEGLIPPTSGCQEPGHRFYLPGLVTRQAQRQPKHASSVLLSARSLGGSHTCLALTRYPERRREDV